MTDTALYKMGKKDAIADLFAIVRKDGILSALLELASSSDNVHTEWFMDRFDDKTLQQYLFKGETK